MVRNLINRFNEEDTGGSVGIGFAFVGGPAREEMSEQDRRDVSALGARFGEAIAAKTPCLVITGRFEPPGGAHATEDQVLQACLKLFGFQKTQAQPGERTINVLLDSTGGSLDSAYKMVRYLTWYADKVNVYVPRQAKSASTLLALGADRIYLSPFAELGPLDTQIHDPRNPTTPVSVLDCYQSVDYVRAFGVHTMSQALRQLSDDARGQIALVDLVESAAAFGIGAISPMLGGVRALDMGAWGRSLQIGERYAQLILRTKTSADHAAEIANRLVYLYTHHLFPIDYREALDIGLDVEIMDAEEYELAMKVVDKCRGSLADGAASRESRSFVDFVTMDGTRPRPTTAEEHGPGVPQSPVPVPVRRIEPSEPAGAPVAAEN